MTRLQAGHLLVFCAVACTAQPRQATVGCEEPEARRFVSVDRRSSVCLPPDFRLVGTTGSAWARGEAADSDYVFISARVISDSDRDEFRQWPPRLDDRARGVLHEVVCDSINAPPPSAAAGERAVSSGLCSGGVAGWQRQPFVVSGWTVTRGRHVLVQGWANRSENLVVLRNAAVSVEAP